MLRILAGTLERASFYEKGTANYEKVNNSFLPTNQALAYNSEDKDDPPACVDYFSRRMEPSTDRRSGNCNFGDFKAVPHAAEALLAMRRTR